MPKIYNKYSQKRNIGVSGPISTFMCLWAKYIFPRWVCHFCLRIYVDRSWEYINRSQTHECGNWGWGRAIPRKGIYKRNCRYSVEALPVLASRGLGDKPVPTAKTLHNLFVYHNSDIGFRCVDADGGGGGPHVLPHPLRGDARGITWFKKNRKSQNTNKIIQRISLY